MQKSVWADPPPWLLWPMGLAVFGLAFYSHIATRPGDSNAVRDPNDGAWWRSLRFIIFANAAGAIIGSLGIFGRKFEAPGWALGLAYAYIVISAVWGSVLLSLKNQRVTTKTPLRKIESRPFVRADGSPDGTEPECLSDPLSSGRTLCGKLTLPGRKYLSAPGPDGSTVLYEVLADMGTSICKECLDRARATTL